MSQTDIGIMGWAALFMIIVGVLLCIMALGVCLSLALFGWMFLKGEITKKQWRIPVGALMIVVAIGGIAGEALYLIRLFAR